MGNKVGPKGQVVIEKELQDRLGVQPGWKAIQFLVEDHIEIHFLPPEHHRSLRGAAKPYIRDTPPPAEDWDREVEGAVAKEYAEKWGK
jgi:bifunctional DNA-binding transcriptional regulator/antitoxin component of YhaV-PrlF toxin-antitoxin module